MEQLTLLYKRTFGALPVRTEVISGSGSNRCYYRLSGAEGGTVIGVAGTSRDENRAFIYLAEHFSRQGLPVPRVMAVSDDEMRYLQTDLGTCSLFDAVAEGRKAGGCYSEREKDLLRRTIAALPAIQIHGARGLDFSRCYPQAEMDATSVMFDLNYFKYCFLKATGVDFHELRLEEDFRRMAADLTRDRQDAFLYRDFQARNVMLDSDGNPFFIDFQGGRRGPVQYDVASFLWQASARYSPALRKELVDVYVTALKQYTEVDEGNFHLRLRSFVLFRLLQVLGAYGFRGYFERKKHFLDSIPPAIQNLRDLLAEDGCPYPTLKQVLTDMVAQPCFAPASQVKKTEAAVETETVKIALEATPSRYDGKGPLRVRVFSFSYRKGIPEDESGNGGGYVFDCRSTHNPGRYEPYKPLTGLDEPVIRFLEDDGEILTFLESVYRLADAHVERYLQRGFTDLMFSFGCTGGRHRSVYSAQHLAEHLHRKYGIEVSVCHREQGISQTWPAVQV
ncbi:MAG: phosphotransferase [Paraprevotella sp.]|nr:phosphotransferase [Paraprevotella sp.]